MEIDDLKNFTREELEEMFVNLINDMETNGNRYMDEYKKDTDRLEMYSYGCGLLTRVNFIKAKVSMKNSVINGFIWTQYLNEYDYKNVYLEDTENSKEEIIRQILEQLEKSKQNKT